MPDATQLESHPETQSKNWSKHADENLLVVYSEALARKHEEEFFELN